LQPQFCVNVEEKDICAMTAWNVGGCNSVPLDCLN